jgi:hypothetical protein
MKSWSLVPRASMRRTWAILACGWSTSRAVPLSLSTTFMPSGVSDALQKDRASDEVRASRPRKVLVSSEVRFQRRALAFRRVVGCGRFRRRPEIGGLPICLGCSQTRSLNERDPPRNLPNADSKAVTPISPAAQKFHLFILCSTLDNSVTVSSSSVKSELSHGHVRF